jgi:serine/threonine protein kinase
MNGSVETLSAALADRYRIDRKLGSGGMADVYLAHDLRHDREVAIKVMRPELAQSLGTERFLREIRLLAQLQHPHILGLVDSGEAAGMLYYVMPYLPSGSLRDKLDRERELPIADALSILRAIAEALEHAHAQGIVHRDVKPENVLFSSGHAQVADFGIARIVAGSDAASTALTTLGMTIGTPQYMAPEQASGDPRTDHRADLYAFGVLAYEVLAGAPPFTGANAAQLISQHMTERPAPLAKRRPSVPAVLDALVMRCLEKHPADRWQSARDVIAAIDRAATAAQDAVSGPRSAGTVTAHKTINETTVRRLDRKSFDPRMLGDTLEYLDNRVESDVLVVMFNAIWLDGTDFEPHLRTLPYHCIAPTLYGFTSRARHRAALSLRDHMVLLAELIEGVAQEQTPSLLLLAGFSASGDLVMKLPAVMAEAGRTPDGVLALGPNQGMETCFISRVMAELSSNDPATLLAAFRSIGEIAGSLDDWIIINGYLGRIMTRFRSDVTPLSALGRDIIAPFIEDEPGTFAAMYRDVTARVPLVRCVFEDSETCNRLLRRDLVDHMDRGILGPHHRDGSLLLEPTPSHFEITQPERIAAHLAAMVEELRELRRRA